jgi:hypothetical protein
VNLSKRLRRLPSLPPAQARHEAGLLAIQLGMLLPRAHGRPSLYGPLKAAREQLCSRLQDRGGRRA